VTSVASTMSAKRTTPFQPAHCLMYGLLITGRGLDKDVTCVQCQFCLYDGRSGDDVGRKRVRTVNVQMYTPPYRPELYRKHLERQHADKWLEYQSMAMSVKKAYFDSKKEAAMKNSVASFVIKGADALEITIARNIVEDLIATLYFHPDDDAADGDDAPISKTNAMKLFKLNENDNNGTATAATYSVTIKNTMRFWLAIDHTSSGLSFRQTAEVMEHHRIRTKNPKLVGLNDHMVSQFVRVLVGANLQTISNILSKRQMFAFSIAGDGSTHFDSSFFDIRIRVGVNGVLHNLHLVIVPFFGRHTAVNILELVVKILDVLFLSWRDKLISVSSDGENTMTGRKGGFVTLLEKEATHKILRVWCAPHQMDIVIKKVTKAMMNGRFYKIAHAFSVHLRAQLNLIAAMNGTKCPKDTTRWVAFGKMLKWFLFNRRRLLEYIVEKEPIQAPLPAWWVLCAAVAPLFESLQVTFAILQSKQLVLSQQAVEIEELVSRICVGIGIGHEVGNAEYMFLDDDAFIKVSEWWIAFDSIKGHIHDQGSWARDAFAALSAEDQDATLRDIAVFSVNLVDGLNQVRAERDSNNDAREEDSPPVFPLELAALRPRDFISCVLDPRRDHLAKFWTPDEIENVERDHNSLFKAYNDGFDTSVKDIIDLHDHKTMFNDAWDSIKGRYNFLRCFSAGLATSFANTTSVESDFSILKWSKDSHRRSLTNLSLEGVFASKDYAVLSRI
jgi:hypothetical protein